MLANLPAGTLPITAFTEKHGVPYRAFRHYIEIGIAGDRIEVTAMEHPTRSDYKIKFLTPDQQEHAIKFLETHGIAYSNPLP
jgi:hypothetical protein